MVTIKLNTKTAPLNIIQVYAPTSESEGEEKEEEVEQFYSDVKNKIPNREMYIIMGDVNAKIGECGIGPHRFRRKK